MASNTFISYNVASSSSLSGLNILLSIFKPIMAFLQEVTLSTNQLLAFVGHNYKGVSNVDPSSMSKPGCAVIWKSELDDIVVQNVGALRLQLVES